MNWYDIGTINYTKALLILGGLFLLDIVIWWLFNQDRRKLRCLLGHAWDYSQANGFSDAYCKNCGVGK